MQLSEDQLENIRNFSTCSVTNAIETFDLMSRNTGFMGPEIKSVFPGMPHMIGYAVTAVITADMPASKNMNVSRLDLIEAILRTPAPRIVVIKDLDYPNVIGSFWGEVQANIHRSVGCVGTITDGGVRDLDELRRLQFNAFATNILVSHAYVHLVDVDIPINVGGLDVTPGDLLLGDQHGVTGIPLEIAKDIPEAVRLVENREQEMIKLCEDNNFTVDRLKEQIRKMYGS